MEGEIDIREKIMGDRPERKEEVGENARKGRVRNIGEREREKKVG